MNTSPPKNNTTRNRQKPRPYLTGAPRHQPDYIPTQKSSPRKSRSSPTPTLTDEVRELRRELERLREELASKRG